MKEICDRVPAVVPGAVLPLKLLDGATEAVGFWLEGRRQPVCIPDSTGTLKSMTFSQTGSWKALRRPLPSRFPLLCSVVV
jgi:hypothetical protein